MALIPFTGPFGQLGTPARRALIELMTPRYLEGPFPTPEALAAHFALPLGSPAHAEKLAEVHRQAADLIAETINEEAQVSALFAPRAAGSLAAVATMQTVRGGGPVPIGRTIGAATSTLPTHRLLRGFRYLPEAGLDPDATPESALAEFTRLVVASPEQLRPLVEGGTLTPAEATYVTRHGLDEMVSQSFAHDQWRAQPPRAYLFNTRPRLARVLRRRKGLRLIPLYRDGAEPTPRTMEPGRFNAPYFRRWAEELATLVPPAIMADGTAAAVAWLAGRDFAAWETLSLSLPYLLANDAATAAAMARMADACARATQEEVRAAD